MDYPKLRNVEIFPIKREGQNLICFRDPLRVTENIVFLPYWALSIISMFDGNHSIRDIQAEYMRSHGELLYSDQILEIALGLDEHYLLESTRFRAYYKKLEDDFAKSPVRKALIAGNGYDSNPDNLRSLLEGFFSQDGAPGSAPRPDTKPSGLKGLVAPHIDFLRGSPCYAWAYKEAAETSTEEVFVLLGTSHMPMERYFALTNKGFDTPFGVLPVDRLIMERLEEKLGNRFFFDQFLHRNEHSLEFQAVYLGYLFSGRRNISIVPILCGSFHDIIQRASSPRDVEEVNLFLDTLGAVIEEEGRKVCFLAGADLAHVGPQFGDRFHVTQTVMDTLRIKDLSMLDYAVRGDEDGFYDFIFQEGDKRKICGLPPIYALLRLLHDGAQGSLLNYSQWRDPEGNGAVTFASLAFH